MSVLGIAGGGLLGYLAQNVTQSAQSGAQTVQNSNNNGQSRVQQFQQEFQQLGQDLQSGNLTGAQSVFATLQQNAPPNFANAASQNNPIASAFNQLSQDLQSGNLSAAQQQYTAIQQDFQNGASQAATANVTPGHGARHHVPRGDSNTSQGSQDGISQLLNQLGTALQQGNLSNAQQAYNSLQQDLLQFTGNALGSASAAAAAGSNGAGVSVNA
jgi:outer membrane protein assembly factor BamD (BamD/ComL family)